MALGGLERRIEGLERRARIADTDDPDRNRRILLELLPGLVEVWLERACLARLGYDPPADNGTETNFLREAVIGHPLFREEVRRRVPVCEAWWRWYDAHEAGYRGKLPEEDGARWAWVCGAVYCARRDGPRNAEERALLDAAESARVGREEEERSRVRAMVLRILSEVVGKAEPSGVPCPSVRVRGGDTRPPKTGRNAGLWGGL